MPELQASDSITGMVLSNGTDSDHDIDIAAGVCWASTDNYQMLLGSTMTKQIDAVWAVGTGNGGLFSGSVTTNERYHVFIIRKDSDGTIDAGFDTSDIAANIPSGYSHYRRIGMVYTDASSNILAFTQTDRVFVLGTAIEEFNDATPASTSEHTVALSIPSENGIEWLGGIYSKRTSASTTLSYRTGIHPSMSDESGTTGKHVQLRLPIDDAGFYFTPGATTGWDNLEVYTYGWVDGAGRTTTTGKTPVAESIPL